MTDLHVPDGFFFPRSRAEAIARVAIRTTEERTQLRLIIAQEKVGTIGEHYTTVGFESPWAVDSRRRQG